MARIFSGRTLSARDWLRLIVNRISRKIQPEKIILFGSYAYGRPRKHSDIDLFIVWNTRETRPLRHLAVSKAIGPRFYPMDIVVRTPLELAERKDWLDPFTHEIMTRGIVLYDRAQGRSPRVD
ncbi:MAG: nucleotidyltransferase domain-containing protein [Elusimicrobia bacterium]|nr:nucleotidyltransferase domain-containing protein [Elusimicrobiota bacterium]